MQTAQTMSKSQIINLLNGKQVKRNIENYKTNDQLKQELQLLCISNGIDEKLISENEYGFYIEGHNVIFRKEKRKQDEIGTLKFRTKDYIFNNCYGEIPKKENFFSNENEIGFFIVDLCGNKITYTLDSAKV